MEDVVKAASDKGCTQWHLISCPTLSRDEIIWPTTSFYRWGTRGPSWKVSCLSFQNNSSGPRRCRPITPSSVGFPCTTTCTPGASCLLQTFPCFLTHCPFIALTREWVPRATASCPRENWAPTNHVFLQRPGAHQLWHRLQNAEGTGSCWGRKSHRARGML